MVFRKTLENNVRDVCSSDLICFNFNGLIFKVTVLMHDIAWACWTMSYWNAKSEFCHSVTGISTEPRARMLTSYQVLLCCAAGLLAVKMSAQ